MEQKNFYKKLFYYLCSNIGVIDIKDNNKKYTLMGVEVFNPFGISLIEDKTGFTDYRKDIENFKFQFRNVNKLHREISVPVMNEELETIEFKKIIPIVELAKKYMIGDWEYDKQHMCAIMKNTDIVGKISVEIKELFSFDFITGRFMYNGRAIPVRLELFEILIDWGFWIFGNSYFSEGKIMEIN